ncbi:MAG: hypothetical protein EPO65_09600 [Dehalococcoidia bacterium]|nr:MAG: hypothetical protein EPO65_09600 [Dehalococcoidia bacterium]
MTIAAAPSRLARLGASIVRIVTRLRSVAPRRRGAVSAVPRTHPFGWGRSCDGCDVPGQWLLLSNDGYYCDACADYVIETTGALPARTPATDRGA